MTNTIAADYDPLLMSADENSEVTEPEQVQFSVLRRGEESPIGPFTQEEILQMLQAGDLEKSDFIFFEGMGGWERIDDVFEIQEQISHFVDDGQDKVKVAETFREASEILATGESIYYIAIQEKTGLLHKGKLSVILTNKRLLMLHEKRNGYEMESYRWEPISNTLMKDEGKGLATFSVLLDGGKRIDVTHIPFPQVQRLFQLSQELRDLEEEEV